MAEYSLPQEKIDQLADTELRAEISVLAGQSFLNDVQHKNEIKSILGPERAKQYESELITITSQISPNTEVGC